MDTKTQQFMAEVQRLKSFFDEREMFVDETTLGNLASANLEHFGYRDAPNEEPKVETYTAYLLGDDKKVTTG